MALVEGFGLDIALAQWLCQLTLRTPGDWSSEVVNRLMKLDEKVEMFQHGNMIGKVSEMIGVLFEGDFPCQSTTSRVLMPRFVGND